MKCKKEILVVSFGTSVHNSRSASIGAIESTIQEQFPEWQVRRAFTSKMIISALWKRDKIRIDTVEEALERALENEIDTLIVQPTYFVKGKEFEELKESVSAYAGQFQKLYFSDPVLSDENDYRDIVSILSKRLTKYQSDDTAVCFMGHGTSLEADASYRKIQNFMSKKHPNWYVATLESRPDIREILAQIKEKGGYKKVILVPLLVAAGRHALSDMAGEKENSWKSIFEQAGFDVTCILEGMGQYYDMQQVYVEHIRKALAAAAE